MIYEHFIGIVCYVITCEYANNQKLNPNYEKKFRWVYVGFKSSEAEKARKRLGNIKARKRLGNIKARKMLGKRKRSEVEKARKKKTLGSRKSSEKARKQKKARLEVEKKLGKGTETETGSEVEKARKWLGS